MREQQYKCQYTKREKTELLLSNLNKTYREPFLQCYNTRYKSRSSRRTIHYDLKYSNLAHTLSVWAKDLSLQAIVHYASNDSSELSISNYSSEDNSSCQVYYVIHNMQINALRYPEQHCSLRDQKGYEDHTCNIMINYILAENTMCKDPSLKDKIIKSCKHFRCRCQFTPNNHNKTSKWKPQMLKDKLNSIPNYKIHQALVGMLHKDHKEPNDPSEASRIYAILTTVDENDEIEFVINQLLDPKYQYDLSSLAKQTEPSIINSSAHEQIHVIKHNLSTLVQVDNGAQTTTCDEKQLLHNYQLYSYSCRKPSILGGDKIVHHSEGYGYICIVTSDNKLIKIKFGIYTNISNHHNQPWSL